MTGPQWVLFAVCCIVAGVVVGFAQNAWRRRRGQRACVHHDRSTGETWLNSWLIDMGSRKLWRCRECGQSWI